MKSEFVTSTVCDRHLENSAVGQSFTNDTIMALGLNKFGHPYKRHFSKVSTLTLVTLFHHSFVL